ncbi:MAG: nicotinamide-nucleotide amidohydrolase family protein [Chloroflexi bacterium]|nr:nicotinamide-nucleotide amidohydrolase family protein [Chloroflexota bacterium]MCL5273356.1 nicotinamide-nucleotide amidohydrolase family protein [Chloroflexota bacterium]
MYIRKLDYRGVEKARYEGEVLARDEHGVLIQATWARPAVSLGFVTFERGDVLRESFYNDRWYNVFEIYSAQGCLKGWYADVARPARISADSLEWEDLLLDIWMNPAGELQTLDEDEFSAAEPDLTPLERTVARNTLDVLRQELLRRWRAYMNDRIAQALKGRRWSAATAESCTGGLIGDELTNRAGSSDYFMGGVISYDNRIKQQALGVSAETLAQSGAVSEACALEMARGVRRALGVHVGVSATGIAGPGGGSPEKPVGLVFIGVSTPRTELVRRFVWPHDRIGNKRATADAALRMLLEVLESDAGERE